MKYFFALLTAILVCHSPIRLAFAQQPAIVPAPTPVATDSTRQSRSAADTIPATVERNGIRVPNSGATRPVLTPNSGFSSLSVDTVRVTQKQEAQIRKIIPRKATLRSLMLPGLGQAYNRQYYKIPFIYAGFGVMGYLFVKYRGLASEAADGYRLLLYGPPKEYVTVPPDNVPGTIMKPVLIPGVVAYSGNKVTEVQIGDNIIRSTATAKNAYDLYRRYRDLNILLSAALWGINIVEANVAAHLKTFDLTDDISMRIEPGALPIPGAGIVPGVRVAFTFK
ncbi:DUF5683 domain-containing protein [Spirosoma soli]|uniref:DUF5683 domain-containing protein n=1 Tax=Spirosoma soli TaxID=1770529 RepID=A0ABW5LYC4_9BACT